MATTTNFGWETPDDTDLVKDGAAAIRTLGQAIDTSMADLEGGTTGQVLSKASNADMDFTWTNADPLVILDAKGDLISATAADTPARLAVGTNGQVLTADSTTSTGLKWATAASGGMTLLSTTTLSGSVTTVSSIDQTYNSLFCVVSGFTSATFASVGIRYNGVSTGYYGVSMADSTTSNTRQTNTTSIDTAIGEAPRYDSANGLLSFTIANYASTGFHHIPFEIVYIGNDTSVLRVVRGIGANSNTSAVTSVSIGMGPSLTGGTIKIYGVK
jgi:hypothetical protein